MTTKAVEAARNVGLAEGFQQDVKLASVVVGQVCKPRDQQHRQSRPPRHELARQTELLAAAKTA